MTGYVPPEFGYKAGGVIEVRSAAAASAGTALADVGGPAATRRATVGQSRRASRRPRSICARARSRRGPIASSIPCIPTISTTPAARPATFGQVGWSACAPRRVTAGWGFGRRASTCRTPRQQEEAGQDQRQRVGQRLVNVTWQRTLVVRDGRRMRPPTTAARARGSTAATLDTPLARGRRSHACARTGVLVAATHQRGGHLLKAGVGSAAPRAATRRSPSPSPTRTRPKKPGLARRRSSSRPDEPFVFSGERDADALCRSTSRIVAGWRALTVSGGVRFDRSRLLLERSQWSPRVGAARSARRRPRLRAAAEPLLPAAAAREPAALLVAGSARAVAHRGRRRRRRRGRRARAAVGLGGRRRAPAWRRVRLDAAYWRRQHRGRGRSQRVRRHDDHLSQRRGRGPRARLRPAAGSAAPARLVGVRQLVAGQGASRPGRSPAACSSRTRSRRSGPASSSRPTTTSASLPAAGVTWEHGASGLACRRSRRYETGTPIQREEDDEDELAERPGADTRGLRRAAACKPRTLVSLLRRARRCCSSDAATRDRGRCGAEPVRPRYAYNFGNPFSGTHFGAPRSIAATLRVAFG